MKNHFHEVAGDVTSAPFQLTTKRASLPADLEDPRARRGADRPSSRRPRRSV